MTSLAFILHLELVDASFSANDRPRLYKPSPGRCRCPQASLFPACSGNHSRTEWPGVREPTARPAETRARTNILSQPRDICAGLGGGGGGVTHRGQRLQRCVREHFAGVCVLVPPCHQEIPARAENDRIKKMSDVGTSRGGQAINSWTKNKASTSSKVEAARRNLRDS